MSSKRDYVKAAKVLADHPDEAARRFAAELLVQVFAEDNPRFDRERFLVACGVKEAS